MSSFTINRVVLVGRLTRDPELRELRSGSGVCSLRIACNSTRRDGDGGYSDKPNYFDVSAFGGTAESVSRYTRKGSRVAVDGRLEWREWETSDQERRQSVTVVAGTVMFLDRPGERVDSDEQPNGASSDGSSGGEDAELVGVGTGAAGDDLVF